MYRYVGEIDRKDGNGKSHWQGEGGDSGMWGGNVGEVVVFNDFRNIYMAFNKALWLALGGELNTNSVLDIVGSSSGSQIGSAGSLGGISSTVPSISPDASSQIAALNAQIAALQKQLASASSNTDIGVLHQQIATLEAQLTEKTRIAESLRVELEALKKQSVRSDDDVTGDGGFL